LAALERQSRAFDLVVATKERFDLKAVRVALYLYSELSTFIKLTIKVFIFI
jgi:hypothetical protein